MNNDSAAEMPKHVCHKEVWALQIKEVEHEDVTILKFVDARYSDRVVSYAWHDKHRPEAGGYFVVYGDGYESYSPAGAFESGYTLKA